MTNEASHDFDDEGICRRCGLDGAEFAHCRNLFRSEIARYEPLEIVREEVEGAYPWPKCNDSGAVGKRPSE